MKRFIEDIRASCQRTLVTLKSTLGVGSTDTVDPYNLSGKPCLAALKVENEVRQLAARLALAQYVPHAPIRRTRSPGLSGVPR